MKFILRLIAIFALLASSGCVGTLADLERDRLIRSGFSEAYADGFSHGFQSGQSASGNPYASHSKNTERYRLENEYKQGWDDGFAKGKGQYDSIQRAVNSL